MADLDYEGFWNETLIQLRTDLGEEEFSGWFSDMKYLRCMVSGGGENNIVVGVPSAFHRDKVKSRYQGKITSKLMQLSGSEIAIEYEITGKAVRKEAPAPIEAKKNAVENEDSAVINELEAQKAKKKKEKHPQMRDDFTFDSYIIGENNIFAANAALAISTNPGKNYNPFFIFGGVGLGKTHLMQAIGNHIHENSENKVIFVTAENFLNEYVEGIRHNDMPAFRNKFRFIDVLLIDDIQILYDKDGVQEELFHTFNALANAKKQLVFTCDRPPSDLKKFSERLITRFEQGVRADLKPPRYEERFAILKTTAERWNAKIPNEVIDYVSNNVSSNIRDLISIFYNLIEFAKLTERSLTLELTQQRFKDLSISRQDNFSIDNIIRVVSEYFSLTPNDLKGKKKTQNIVFARQLAMYIARIATEYSTTELGQEFGGRDHTTVIHSIEKINNKLLADSTMENTIENLKRSIKEFSAKH
jgi:chromosomal replication initiator protein